MSWMPLKKYCESNPWPTLHTMRWMIYKSKSISGIHPPFVRKLGHGLLIDHDKFQQWISDDEGNRLMQRWAERRKDQQAKQRADQLDMFREGVQALC